jgi:hypothetical protein
MKACELPHQPDYGQLVTGAANGRSGLRAGYPVADHVRRSGQMSIGLIAG